MANTTTANINVHDLLQVADAVAREKMLNREIIINALEEAIAKSAKQKYGSDYDIRVSLVPKTGDIVVERYREVVDTLPEDAEFPNYFILEKDALELEYDICEVTLSTEEGELIKRYVIDNLPAVNIGRISAQSARQVIIQKIREAEAESQYEAFKDRIGEIMHGVVKRVEFGHVMVSLGDHGEGIIRSREMIPHEIVKPGDKIRCYIYDVQKDNAGSRVLLSRTHPQFLARLFAAEVPEIYEGTIEIKSVARDPGSRAKIAIHTEDMSLDPVGSCVGVRGSRVQAVTAELQGERIDIIPWSEDAVTFIMNSLNPIPVIRVIVDENGDKIEIVVPDEYLPQVIGRRGQNVRLLSNLLGWHVDVTTETDDATKRQGEFAKKTDMFVEELDVDTLLAQFLVSEGFSTVEDIAYIDIEELASIEAIDTDMATALQERALQALEERKTSELDKLGVSKVLREMEGLTIDMLLILAKAGIKSLGDFAGLTASELVEVPLEEETEIEDEPPLLKAYDLSEEQVNRMIMGARKALGWIE